MKNNILSVVIPAYNEKNTIQEILKRVQAVNLPLQKEIVIVDDCSTDGTRDILRELEKNSTGGNLKIVFKEKNEGKGSALKAGLLAASGDILIIQDADLEYNPEDFKKILKPILDNQADVVYGSRILSGDAKRVFYVYHFLGNIFLTLLSDLLTGLSFTDMETCYKAFTKKVADSFKHELKSKRFGIEPEITARIAKGRWRLYEVGISFYGRTYEQGKKINWKDGFAAIWHIIRFNLFE
ncbi:MAG: glycosyltransferase family 2 protein [Candidatus Zambryskibacteria bacterium]|nr:glycosyltransferase family 2 protein [Candidatus Zambryskibacteria bacterium]